VKKKQFLEDRGWRVCTVLAADCDQRWVARQASRLATIVEDRTQDFEKLDHINRPTVEYLPLQEEQIEAIRSQNRSEQRTKPLRKKARRAKRKRLIAATEPITPPLQLQSTPVKQQLRFVFPWKAIFEVIGAVILIILLFQEPGTGIGVIIIIMIPTFFGAFSGGAAKASSMFKGGLRVLGAIAMIFFFFGLLGSIL
jgi:hypothetical protein